MGTRPPTDIPSSSLSSSDFIEELNEDGSISLADGKIKKIIIKRAHDQAMCPPPQAQVTVHYIGHFVDGRCFDNSRVRSSPFTFRLGGQAVIRGWEIAIRSMKLGEIAKFEIASELAYGSEGRLPEIPPNTPLNFEIELLDWSMKQKVTEDGGIYKVIVDAGVGPNRPNEFASVNIRYQGRNIKGQVFDQEHWSTPFTYILSSTTSPPVGFDDCLRNMYRGEHSIFTLRADYAWGEKGCPVKGVAVGEEVVYEIILDDFTKGRESWEMSFPEKLDRMTRLKDLGNGYFKQGDMKRAYQKYEQASKLIQYDAYLSDTEKSQLNAMKIISYQNMSIVRSKEQKWEDVIKQCTQGLTLDPKHVKCLFLRGKAYTALNDSDKAFKDLKLAASLQPENVEIKQALRGIESSIAAVRAREQSMWGGLFSRPNVALSDKNANMEQDKNKKEDTKPKSHSQDDDSDEEDLDAQEESPEEARTRDAEARAMAVQEARDMETDS